MSASNTNVRFAAIAAAVLGAGMILPAACLFPDYTFDRKGSGGGGTGGTGTTSSSGTTTTSSGSMGGGGTTSSSSSSSSTNSSSSTTSSSSSSSGEPCTTQDCSDPACQSDFQCVPSSPPSGWTGYFALYDGAPAGDPGCPSEFPTSVYLGNGSPTVPAAKCSACTCTPPTGRTCEVSDTIDVNDGACGSSVDCSGKVAPPANWTGTCFGVNGLIAGVKTCGPQTDMTCSSGTQACNVAESMTALKITGGSCTANTQTPTLPPVTWGTAGEACNGGTPTGKGCGVGQCLPKPKAPFVSGMCIKHTGDVSQCPAGIFTERHVFYDPAATQDTRSCTACSCDPPAGGTCSATVNVYSANTCMGTPIATLHPTTTAGDCANLSGNPAVAGFNAIFAAPTGGSCPASGGQPQGTATPQSATTFCCVQ